MNRPDVCPINRVDCTECGFRRDDECNHSHKNDSTLQERARVAEEELFASYSKLIGCKVTGIRRYSHHFDTATLYAITFDDGRILVAEDGEYGEDAFHFATEEELDYKEVGDE